MDMPGLSVWEVIIPDVNGILIGRYSSAIITTDNSSVNECAARSFALVRSYNFYKYLR